MNINKILTAALKPLCPNVTPHVHTGIEATYYVFNYFSLGDYYADDAPCLERYLVQVHLFCPLKVNSIELIEQTKQALKVADFTWPSVTDISDEDGQHLIFECEYVMGVDLDGSNGD